MTESPPKSSTKKALLNQGFDHKSFTSCYGLPGASVWSSVSGDIILS
tara:strand:+ start:119658 stop:119798 length:141 start_codon:yes stop_codon:yes gene_type:complete